LDSSVLVVDSHLELIGRLALALFFGALVGWEREMQNKPAGLRTHMLVSLGSAILVLIPIVLEIPQNDTNAFTRVLQGIISGVGFLGAGEIISDPQPRSQGYRVRGLTTAAATWIAAALGIAAGCGLVFLGLLGVLLAWLVLRAFKKLEED